MTMTFSDFVIHGRMVGKVSVPSETVSLSLLRTFRAVTGECSSNAVHCSDRNLVCSTSTTFIVAANHSVNLVDERQVSFELQHRKSYSFSSRASVDDSSSGQN
jgi:hypothetical protein